jgi:ABC-type antimicrobial peptide transport system permease subunit
MLKNYLKIAFRNLQRNSIYSFINIAGLAVGIACSILIILWVWDEVSYDRFHTNADRLGQLWLHNEFSDNISSSQAVPLPTYEFFKTFDSRIKNTSIAHWPYEHLLTVGETKITKTGQFASPEFLAMFQFPFVKGSASTALNDASSIVITESLATSLFGDQDPINQIIRVENQYDLNVTGVLKDLPANSSFDFEFLAPWAIYANQDWIKSKADAWDDQSFQVYVELQPDASMEEVSGSIKKVISKKNKDSKVDLFIHPLTDWRLRSSFKNGVQIGGMIDYVNSFSLIAAFILIIACINFMNLATARSERRAREVGIRKSIGSRRRELIFQFLGESIMISAIAFFMAVVLVEISLPLYNQLVEKTLTINYTSPITWLLAFAFIAITGFFAGSYPAFYLSSFNPAKVLKGKLHAGRNAAAPRKVLVSLQFFFSIFLLVGMAVIFLQIQHVKSRDTGYNRENMITITSNEELNKNYKAIKQELLTLGIAQSVTVSSSPITEIYGNNTLGWPGKPADQNILFSRVVTGYDYSKTMGIRMIEGRDFSEEFKSDSSAIILNKAGAEAIGVDNPIGMKIDLWSDQWTVVGVIDDVIMASPFRQVQPGFFLLNPAWGEVVTIRLEKTTDLNVTIEKMKGVFKKLNPSYPFEFQFVDEQFAKKFSSINLIGTLASLFAILAIFITCLGLFGLATFTAEQRTKEIGIRKVMGASTISIMTLLSKDFTRLVLVGFALAAPIAWWALNNYLDRYEYHVTISWWIIPVAGLGALLLTLIIVMTQTLKVTEVNPAQSLRSE